MLTENLYLLPPTSSMLTKNLDLLIRLPKLLFDYFLNEKTP